MTVWNSGNVVERRFGAAHREANDGKDIWNKYFPDFVAGKSARDYILSRILARPRDLVYLVKGAISNAVNRGHSHVEPKDVKDAEYIYSRYAIDSILVENSITIPQLELVLYEFAGFPCIISESNLIAAFEKSRISVEKRSAVVEHLTWLSFFGLEVEENRFEFSDDPKEYLKNSVLAKRVAEKTGNRRFLIHPAFRAYLEISESESGAKSGMAL